MSTDIIKRTGINSKGFGTIPKLVMTDRNISASAKAIYAYLCSFSGAGESCFPGKDRMSADLGISKDTLTKYIKQLVSAGYISVEQKKIGGKFSHNVYIIFDSIEPNHEFTESENFGHEKIGHENFGSEKTVPEDLAPINNNNKINSFKNNSTNTNNLSIKDGSVDDIAMYRELIKRNIGYETLILPDQHNDISRLDEIVEIMTETVVLNKNPVIINKNSVPAELVKSRFLKLGFEDISYVLDATSKNTAKIGNIRGYLISTLYNSYTSKNNYINAEVMHDLYGT
ncbi:MAG: helix-turn-helix domain-containing protein [Clostridia bacterium]|nr:helix-turn-helix domain-containing protein [Clostridia bacterium]